MSFRLKPNKNKRHNGAKKVPAATKWLKELAALSTLAANRHPVDEFIQDPETAWPCHFKATERGDYDDFVCAKCGKVAGRLYYNETILTTGDRLQRLWFILDPVLGVI